MAWRGIWGNRLRALLTMLGVVIGVAAVIILVAIGNGASRVITSRIETLGTNLLFVSPAAGTSFTLSQVPYIEQTVPMAERVVPVLDSAAKMTVGTTSVGVPVVGTTPSYASLGGVNLATGRFLTTVDGRFSRHVVVLGANVSLNLFGHSNPVGQTVALLGQQFHVIGVLNPVGQGPGTSQDNEVFVPLSVAQSLLGSDAISLIMVQTPSPQQASLATDLLTNLYTNLYGGPGSVSIASEDQVLATLSATRQTFTDLLAGTAGISLLVGGIGIMNIMLVSVTERTREIGIRRAVGAVPEDVVLQFLLESMGISLAGGVMGIGLGLALLRLAPLILHSPAVFSPTSVVLAFVFSTLVGLGFGLYPAVRASRLNPIEALRYTG
jgi:putative ABC transport system permease protein